MPVVRPLAAQLVGRGERVRVLVPESEREGWPDGVSVRIGSVADPVAFGAAVPGASRVFLAGLVGAPLGPLRALTNALISHDVGRVVVLGSHGSDFEQEISAETWAWSAFERSLDTRGIGWAYLRPTAVMAHTRVGGYPISGSGMVARIENREPVYEYLPNAPYAFIHERDLAEIAAHTLLDNGYQGTIDVSGTTVSAAERLATLAAVLGTDAVIAEMTAARATERWRRERWPEDTIAVMRYALPAFAADRDNPALREQEKRAEALLGRAPRTFRQWAEEFAAGAGDPG